MTLTNADMAELVALRRELHRQPELSGQPQALLRERLAVESRWYLAQARVVLDGEARDYFRLVGAGASGYDFRYFSLGVP